MGMHKTIWTMLLLSIVTAWTVGCSGGISKQALAKVTYKGTFEALQQAPEKFIGETVILGGKIIAVHPLAGATELVVLQLALNSSDRPVDNDKSGGRFLVRSDQFLDPALFPAGTLITLVGRLKGSEIQTIGQMPYRYPVIIPEEIKKWPVESDSGPRFHFGIGVGTTF